MTERCAQQDCGREAVGHYDAGSFGNLPICAKHAKANPSHLIYRSGKAEA